MTDNPTPDLGTTLDSCGEVLALYSKRADGGDRSVFDERSAAQEVNRAFQSVADAAMVVVREVPEGRLRVLALRALAAVGIDADAIECAVAWGATPQARGFGPRGLIPAEAVEGLEAVRAAMKALRALPRGPEPAERAEPAAPSDGLPWAISPEDRARIILRCAADASTREELAEKVVKGHGAPSAKAVLKDIERRERADAMFASALVGALAASKRARQMSGSATRSKK